jgi:hypothetical protein
MGFDDLFPGLEGAMRGLRDVWPGPLIRSAGWPFPIIQTLHLLALATLGGAVLLPTLRLMGAGLTSVPASVMEQRLRPLLWAALAMLAITGALMSLVIAPRLYDRPAFLVKTIAIVAALVLTFGVMAPLARTGAAGTSVKTWAGIGAGLWLLAVLVFGTSYGAAPGTFHVLSAAWLLAMALSTPRTRWALGAATAVVVGVLVIVTYGVYHPLEEYDLVMEINRWAMRLGGIAVAAALLWTVLRDPGDTDAAPRFARVMAALTLVAWITVAAAGRWIGLSGGG